MNELEMRIMGQVFVDGNDVDFIVFTALKKDDFWRKKRNTCEAIPAGLLMIRRLSSSYNVVRG